MKTAIQKKSLLCVLSSLLSVQNAWGGMITKSLNVSQCYYDYVQTIQQLNAFPDMCPSLSKQVHHGVYKDYSMSCLNMGQVVARLSFDNSDASCVRAFNGLPTAQFEITRPNPDAQNGSSYTYKFTFDRTKTDGNYHYISSEPNAFAGVLTLVQGDFENNLKKCEAFVKDREKEIEVKVVNKKNYNIFNWERLSPDSITGLNQTGYPKRSLLETCAEAATSKKVW